MATSSFSSWFFPKKSPVDLNRLGLPGFSGKVTPKNVFGHPHHHAAATGAERSMVVKTAYPLVPGAAISATVII